MDKTNECFEKMIKYSSLYKEKNNEFDGLLYGTLIKKQIDKIVIVHTN